MTTWPESATNDALAAYLEGMTTWVEVDDVAVGVLLEAAYRLRTNATVGSVINAIMERRTTPGTPEHSLRVSRVLDTLWPAAASAARLATLTSATSTLRPSLNA